MVFGGLEVLPSLWSTSAGNIGNCGAVVNYALSDLSVLKVSLVDSNQFESNEIYKPM